MLGKLSDWLDHRTGFRKLRDAMLLEHIPGGARWRYVWGSCLAFVFTIQLVTGVLLMLHYSPGDTTAWGSVYFIQYEMDFGWLIRGLHHFGSQTMVVLLGIHMLQVVVAGAQLPPREFNWWLGLGLMGIVLGLSLTGYLLPWDQKGYFATRVATNIAGNMPVIGEHIQRIVVGGPEYGNHTLTQFFTLHVGILPPLLIVLLVAHLAVFRRHGVTAPQPKTTFWFSGGGVVLRMVRDLLIAAILAWPFGWFDFPATQNMFASLGWPNLFEKWIDVPVVTAILIPGLFVLMAVSRLFIRPVSEGYFWPPQAFRDLLACLWVFAIMLSLVIFGHHGNKIDTGVDRSELAWYDYERWAKAGQDGLGANLDAPADRDTEGYPARPEWYFLFLFQLLKYFEGELFLVGTVVIPNGVIVLLALLPLLGYGRMRKLGHALGIIVVVAILAGVSVLTFLALVDDSPRPLLGVSAKKPDKAAEFHQLTVKAGEDAKRAVQLAHFGIPETGARELLRNDPLMRGPKIFAAKCASCHNYGYDAATKDPKKFAEASKRTASDLEGYGSAEWVRGLLSNPSHPKYFGLVPVKKVKDDKGEIDEIKLTGMINWRTKLEKKRRTKAADEIAQEEKDLDFIAKFVVDQAQPKEKRDPELNKKGTELFSEYCGGCHKIQNEGSATAPDLTDYASAGWIRTMIMSPSGPGRYNDRNLMPAFRPMDGPGAQVPLAEFKRAHPRTDLIELSDVDRELVIRWLTKDGRVVFGGQPIAGPVLNQKK